MISAGLAAALMGAWNGVARGEERFEKLAAYLEQTAQDEDSEVTFDVIAGSSGLAALVVVAPDGRTVIDFKAPQSKLGMQHLTLESPEPKRSGGLMQADFPAGVYRFTGKTTAGAVLRGEATLSHAFPTAAHILQPKSEAKNVPINGLQVRWDQVRDAASFVLVIEQERLGLEFRAPLPAATTTFQVPDGVLAPGLDYRLAIGTVGANGNRSFAETSFTTRARRQGPGGTE